MAKRNKGKHCRVPYRISEAGHLLSTKGTRRAGSVLSSEGKRDKAKRRKKGCLNGPPGTFKLTVKQKRNLPKSLQRAIVEHHRRKGDRIFD
jgi:hypothetical protein